MNRPNDRLTAREAAAEKGVHIKSLYVAIRSGRLIAEQESKGSAVMIRRRDLESWRVRSRNAVKVDNG